MTYVEDHRWKDDCGYWLADIPMDADYKIVTREEDALPYLIIVWEENIEETGEPRLFWKVLDMDNELVVGSGEGYIGSYCIHSKDACFEDAEFDLNSHGSRPC